jgi:hypothetical protein
MHATNHYFSKEFNESAMYNETVIDSVLQYPELLRSRKVLLVSFSATGYHKAFILSLLSYSYRVSKKQRHLKNIIATQLFVYIVKQIFIVH